MKQGIIYKATGPGGKVYIGQTTQTLKQRKSAHAFRAKKGDRRGAFQIAILEHGFDAFTWEEIDQAETQGELDRKEKQWIAHYKANEPACGYNTVEGGIGAKQTLETRKEISESKKGKPGTWKGKHLSEETRRKMSEVRKGRTSPMKGIPRTEETRRKLSEAMKGRIPWNKGKKIIAQEAGKC